MPAPPIQLTGQALIDWARNNGWTLTQSATTGPGVKYGDPVWKENRGTDTEKNIHFGITQNGAAYNIDTGQPVTLSSDGHAYNPDGSRLPESPNQNHVIRNIGLAALGIGAGLAVPAIAGALSGGAVGGGGAAVAAGAGATGGAGAGVGAATGAAAGGAAGGAGAAAGTAAGVGGFATFAKDIGHALTAANAGMASGRVAEAQANQAQNDAAIREMGANLTKARDQSTATSTDYARQVHGGLLQGLQDFQVTPPPNIHMGTITGGARPSAIIGAHDIGAGMQRQATLDLLGQGDPNLGGVTSLSKITSPTLPSLPEPNVGQKILGGVAPALNIGSTIWDYLSKASAPRLYSGLPTLPGVPT